MKLFTTFTTLLAMVTAYGQMSNAGNRRLQTALGMSRADHQQLVNAIIRLIRQVEPGAERERSRRRFLMYFAKMPTQSVTKMPETAMKSSKNYRRSRFLENHS